MSFSDPIRRYEATPRLDDSISVHVIILLYYKDNSDDDDDGDGVDHLKERESKYASHGQI